ncbi:short-chain dehydrogenase [Streptomyces xantholiticus]|nr:short-chain dehydrogenase [Streptomyces xantholiticus]
MTGASTGIGRASARYLAQRGWYVYAGVRNPAAAGELAQDLGDTGEPVTVDVTDAAAIEAAVKKIGSERKLHAVVNNAGAAVAGPLESLPLDDFRHQIEVNVTGQLAVAQAALPALRENRGRLLFIGSIGGRIALPLLGAYHASKFALVGLTDSLRLELAHFGVDVVLLEPGNVATEMGQRASRSLRDRMDRIPGEAAGRYGGVLEAARQTEESMAKAGLSPDAVAKAVYTALAARRPKARYLVGPEAHAVAVISHLPAGLRTRIAGSRMPVGRWSPGTGSA